MHLTASDPQAWEIGVFDARTGSFVGNTVEVDTDAGWVRRLLMVVDGLAVSDAEGNVLTYIERGQYVLIDMRSHI